MHEPFTMHDACGIQEILVAAQTNAPVVRAFGDYRTGGPIIRGRAQRICDTVGGLLARTADVRTGVLEVATDTGLVWWPISELINDVRTGYFVVEAT